MADWPVGYDGEHYTEPLRIMLMPSQMAKLRQEAAERGIKNLSGYARLKVTDDQIPSCDVKAIRELAHAINAVGNNFNQFVMLSHASGRLRLTEEIERIGQDLAAALKRVIEL